MSIEVSETDWQPHSAHIHSCIPSNSCPPSYVLCLRGSRWGGKGGQCDGGVWWWRQRKDLSRKHQTSASRIPNPLWVWLWKEGWKKKGRNTDRLNEPFAISSLSGAEPSPALLISPGRRGRRSSTQEKKDTPTEKPANEDSTGRPQEKRPGEAPSIPCIYCFVTPLTNT